MINRELFRKVYDQITAHPETHDQDEFESSCGTTRCVAGWALHFYNPNQDIRQTAFEINDSVHGGPGNAARKILGLSEHQAGRLFYEVSDKEAVEIVKKCAGR